MISRGAYSLNAWQWNVSPRGTFLGYKVSFGIFNLDEFIVEPGFEKPKGF